MDKKFVSAADTVTIKFFDANKLSEILEVFRKEYSGHRVMVYDTYMVYKVAEGYADKAAIKANELIKKLCLPLIAIPTDSYTKHCFVVKMENYKNY